MTTPEITVIIPALNAATTIREQLDALCEQDVRVPWELVVADNGSTDGTAEVVRSYEDRLPVRIVRAERRGINVARNAGAAAARGEHLLFCDADDAVRPDWIRRMANALRHDDGVGSAVDHRTLNRAHGLPQPLDPSNPRPVRPPVVEFLPYPLGASCGVRRSVWEAVGGFDERYAAGGDDMEFFWRLQVRGYTFHAISDPLVRYRLPRSLEDAMSKGFRKGRAGAEVYRRFQHAGARFHPRRALLLWGGLVVRSYRLLQGPDPRADWLIRASQCAGRLVGGLRQRIVYF